MCAMCACVRFVDVQSSFLSISLLLITLQVRVHTQFSATVNYDRVDGGSSFIAAVHFRRQNTSRTYSRVYPIVLATLESSYRSALPMKASELS
jgi:hypothetical protein